MTDITNILSRMDSGDPRAAEQLLPLVYDELGKPAAARMAQEAPGQMQQGKTLVYEADVGLVDNYNPPLWDSRGHFFAAEWNGSRCRRPISNRMVLGNADCSLSTMRSRYWLTRIRAKRSTSSRNSSAPSRPQPASPSML